MKTELISERNRTQIAVSKSSVIYATANITNINLCDAM